MKKGSIEGEVRQIVKANLKKRGLKLNIGDTHHLIGSGLIDSLGAMELVSELEKVFEIKITSSEMTESNFYSIKKISDFIGQKHK